MADNDSTLKIPDDVRDLANCRNKWNPLGQPRTDEEILRTAFDCLREWLDPPPEQVARSRGLKEALSWMQEMREGVADAMATLELVAMQCSAAEKIKAEVSLDMCRPKLARMDRIIALLKGEDVAQ